MDLSYAAPAMEIKTHFFKHPDKLVPDKLVGLDDRNINNNSYLDPEDNSDDEMTSLLYRNYKDGLHMAAFQRKSTVSSIGSEISARSQVNSKTVGEKRKMKDFASTGKVDNTTSKLKMVKDFHSKGCENKFLPKREQAKEKNTFEGDKVMDEDKVLHRNNETKALRSYSEALRKDTLNEQHSKVVPPRNTSKCDANTRKDVKKCNHALKQDKPHHRLQEKVQPPPKQTEVCIPSSMKPLDEQRQTLLEQSICGTQNYNTKKLHSHCDNQKCISLHDEQKKESKRGSDQEMLSTIFGEMDPVVEYVKQVPSECNVLTGMPNWSHWTDILDKFTKLLPAFTTQVRNIIIPKYVDKFKLGTGWVCCSSFCFCSYY